MKKFAAAVLSLIIALWMPGLQVFAESVPKRVEFRAEFVEKDYDEVTKGKIYIADGVSRYETDNSGEIVVTRRDKKVIWLIFPRFLRYVEQEYIGEPNQVFPDPYPDAAARDNLTREFIGYEWADSFRLRKFLVTVKYPQGEDKYYEWFRDNFPVPVKTSSLDGKVSFEYRNIKTGPQDPNLFVFPKSYKKVGLEEITAMEKNTEKTQKKK